VRDLYRDGRWSTHNVSVLKLSNVSFRGKCARIGNNLKLPSPTKLARLGHFPPASQAGRLAGPVFYVCVFSLTLTLLSRSGCSKLLEKEEKEQEEKQAAKRLVAEQRRLARYILNIPVQPYISISVPDPRHFGTDPNPQIRTSD
jgi:hypothetical protein